MNSHPIFNNMDEIQITRVIDAMIKIEVPKGSICSQQGKVGRSFYAIETGEFSMKTVLPDHTEVKKMLGPGESFGEIFIFDTPRMNTVIAESGGILWTIERSTFRRTLEIYERMKIKERIKFLRQLSLFSYLTSDEMTRLAEACVYLYYEAGEKIIHKGDKINNQSDFYIVCQGEVICSDPDNPSEEEKLTLGVGKYFGERAFLTDEPRSKTVTAKTDVTLIALDKESFIKLLGPVEPILSRSLESYGTIVLKEIPILSFLTQSERDEIFQLRHEVAYKKGTVIYHKNSDVTDFHIIMKGNIVRSYLYKKDKKIVLYIIIYLYLNRRRMASSESITILDSRSLGIDKKNETGSTPSKVLEVTSSAAIPVEKDDKLKPTTSDNNKNKKTATNNPISRLMHEKERKLQSDFVVNEHELSTSPDFLKPRRQSEWTESDKKEYVNEVLSKGDYFGGTALMMNKGKSPYTYTADTDVECMTISALDFEKIIQKPNARRYLKSCLLADEISNGNSSNNNNKTIFEENKTTQNRITSVSDFDFIRYLGKGSFGMVVLAKNRLNNQQYALKCIRRESLFKDKKECKDVIISVLQEKLILSTLPQSPFIEQFYGASVDERFLYFIIEYIDGGELHSQMYNSHGEPYILSEKVAKFYCANIVIMLSDLHKERIAYRDLKPENLIVDAKTGYLKLIDFGFAKQVFRKTWTLCGTPYYLAPEILCCTGHDTGADWWTLGIVCYEMMTGETTFSGKDPLETFTLILKGNIDFTAGHFSKEQEDLIKKLLCRSKTLRLGNLSNGAEDVMKHEWFNDIDWEGMRELKVKAPPPQSPPPVKNENKHSDLFQQYIFIFIS